MKQPILSLSQQMLQEQFAAWGEPRFRVTQMWEWLHEKRVASFDAMTNLSKPLREKLEAAYLLRTLAEETHRVSGDKLTEKWLYRVGENLVETVLIRTQHLTRRTVCVSCMVGCPLGCRFCATGQGGYERDLDAGEIIEQVYRADASCLATESLDEPRAIRNVVFMGMGEPLLNYDAVLAAARTMSDQKGMNLSGRHITISTVGVTPGILRLAEENVNFRLAISLHAPSQAIRETLLPAAKRWPLPGLMQALREYAKVASRDITFEYCLVHRLNDGKEHARELVKLLEGFSCKVNLIPLNPTEGFDGVPPPPGRVSAFMDVLERGGVPTTVRFGKGQDIDAACGQLRAKRKVE